MHYATLAFNIPNATYTVLTLHYGGVLSLPTENSFAIDRAWNKERERRLNCEGGLRWKNRKAFSLSLSLSLSFSLFLSQRHYLLEYDKLTIYLSFIDNLIII